MDPGLVVVLGLSVGLLIVGLIGPLLAQLRLRTWREPTEQDRATLDALYQDDSTNLARIVIVETVGEASTEISIRGPPGYRVLFVSDHVLEELDRTIARPLLVAEFTRAKLLYRDYQVVTASIAIGLGSAAFLLVVPFEIGFGGLLVTGAIMLTVGRWLQYRADAKAAAQVGGDELADAFEAVAQRHDADLSRGGWRSYFEVQPRLGDRIHRLRDRD